MRRSIVTSAAIAATSVLMVTGCSSGSSGGSPATNTNSTTSSTSASAPSSTTPGSTTPSSATNAAAGCKGLVGQTVSGVPQIKSVCGHDEYEASRLGCGTSKKSPPFYLVGEKTFSVYGVVGKKWMIDTKNTNSTKLSKQAGCT